MILKEGDAVTYKFPLNNERIIKGVIEFLGETTIWIKSEEGFSVKVKWKDFENIEVSGYS